MREVCKKGISITNSRLLLALADFLGIKTDDAVLDIGCGRGYLTSLLVPKARFVVGVDINPVFAREACERGVKVVLSEDSLPFDNGLFDRIILFHVLEHLTDEEIKYIMGEVRRVLKPNGLLFAGVPVRGWLGWAIWRFRKSFLNRGARDHFGAEDHKQHFYSHRLFRSLFEKNGFREVKKTKNIVISNSFGSFAFLAWTVLRYMPFTLDTLICVKKE